MYIYIGVFIFSIFDTYTKSYVYFTTERWALQTSALGRANVECSKNLARCEHSRRQARRTRAREVVSSWWEGGKRTKLVPTALAVGGRRSAQVKKRK